MRGQNGGSSIDFDSRPYNRSALRAACDKAAIRVTLNVSVILSRLSKK